ncbi:hypothetical protein C7E18_23965, partial [Stenotrophomonas maltophilia]
GRRHMPGLHFEACYYQGIEYCLQRASVSSRRPGDTLYGRLLGRRHMPGLHFEACYYQGIEYCLQRASVSSRRPG